MIKKTKLKNISFFLMTLTDNILPQTKFTPYFQEFQFKFISFYMVSFI